MTTQGANISGTTWKDIVDELSLTIGVRYTLQNVSDSELHLTESATIPTDVVPSHPILPKEKFVIFPKTGMGIWLLAEKNANAVNIVITPSDPNVPTELNGGVPVNLQDQTTRPLIALFNEVGNSTTLLTLAVQDAYEITVTNTTGFVDGKYIILFHPASEKFSFYHQIGAPVGNVITLDTPLDFAYPAGTFVDAAINNMNVDGSGTPRVFGLRGTGAPPGVDLSVDVTRLIFHCTADSAVDLSLFANIAALTNGLVLRRRDGTFQNIFNAKTNHELAGLMYDFTILASLNPVQGQDGFIARLTFAGQNKIGVAIRLAIGEDLEFIIQDDLTDITSFQVTAEGHLLQN